MKSFMQVKFNQGMRKLKVVRTGKKGKTYRYFLPKTFHVTYTASDEYKAQGPHTAYDYNFLMKGEKENRKNFNAWTTLFPFTQAGSWLYIWFGKEYGRNIHIVQGKCILYRQQDEVHVGGHIEVDSEEDEKYSSSLQI